MIRGADRFLADEASFFIYLHLISFAKLVIYRDLILGTGRILHNIGQITTLSLLVEHLDVCSQILHGVTLVQG